MSRAARLGIRKYFTHLDGVVPVHHPRVLVETAALLGAERAALLENSSISEATLTSPEARISYHQFAIITRNALRLTNEPALGLVCGCNIRLAQMGPLAIALMNSANIGHAFVLLARHSHDLFPAFDLELHTKGSRATLRAIETLSLDPFRAFAIEALLASLHAQLRYLIDRPLTDTIVRVPYPAPAWSLRDAEHFPLATAIEFDCTAIELEFDAGLLDVPIAFADPATARLAEQFCFAWFGPRVAEGLLGNVRKLLESERGKLPSLVQLSRMLQTSPRTLRRSLRAMGTSYQEMFDDARRTRAVECVSERAMTFADIAKRLGFSDVRSFRRAYKRWTGHTLHDHRRALYKASNVEKTSAPQAHPAA